MIWFAIIMAVALFVITSVAVYSVAYHRGFDRAWTLAMSHEASYQLMLDDSPVEYEDDDWGWRDYGDTDRAAVEAALRADYARETAQDTAREEYSYGKTDTPRHHTSIPID